MWHNVIFKASFERVQKEGPGPHATYHMAEEMGYMPPEEGVKHVNDNVTLLVEKQLTAPEFPISCTKSQSLFKKTQGRGKTSQSR
jgi:hypothetical protein